MKIDVYQAEQIAEEVYSVLVRHNLTVSEAKIVLNLTKTSFKHARLNDKEKPMFD
ncbi:hypothetical protein [Paenibacillus sp. IHBB 3054]|uniref:hypothetical protein n=1 Tax=Paenibacillus sp. IHBB 3054 TaxID=3425689 RepID=UPI003F6796B2